MSLCRDRVVVVSGAGRGLGRAHALELARQGATLVVNDTGGDVHGSGHDPSVADAVVAEIELLGGSAVANHADAADFDGAAQLIEQAVDTFGRLDVLVNNAGILRDRMLVNMSPDEWHEVVRVHLGSVYACSHHAAAYWRERAKQREVDARIVSTSSPSGLYGNIGQTNYGAAKAGIASFTVIAAAELARYGVTVNAIAPGARTRMTQDLSVLDGATDDPGEGFDELAPENVSPLVAYLASTESSAVTGRVFNVWGGTVSIAEGWHAGPGAVLDRRWQADEFVDVVPGLIESAAGAADMWGRLP